jgi:thioredoxin reductase
MAEIDYDVLIVGGGPAGLSAALTLGRGRKRVLLSDAGPRRNAAATHVHNFVTRDGTPPVEFRHIGREQLQRYPNVHPRESRVERIDGTRGAFEVRLSDGRVRARRILLCTGMVDELPAIEGFRALWGTAIFACPYCHGWEVQDRRFAMLATNDDLVTFAIFLRGWSEDVVALTNGEHEIGEERRRQLATAGVRVEERTITRLVAHGDALAAIQFADGATLERDVLVAHPHQRQVDLVRTLGVHLDARGFVQVGEMRETSIAGIYAAGDAISPAQSAILGAAAGSFAAAAINRELTIELMTGGEAP